MSPLLGLFGTVVGMIEIFGSQTPGGSNPLQLAHGISVALYNTAFGLIVAIPSMIFYRHFRATIDSLVVEMEQQAIKLVDFRAPARPQLGSRCAADPRSPRAAPGAPSTMRSPA
jgi:biopolymer transport protein ExbB